MKIATEKNETGNLIINLSPDTFVNQERKQKKKEKNEK